MDDAASDCINIASQPVLAGWFPRKFVIFLLDYFMHVLFGRIVVVVLMVCSCLEVVWDVCLCLWRVCPGRPVHKFSRSSDTDSMK